MTTTELVAMLKRDPELEVHLTARDTVEVGFRANSAREQNFEFRGTLSPIAEGCELRAHFGAPRVFVLMALVWLVGGLLVLVRQIVIAMSGPRTTAEPWRPVIIGGGSIVLGALIFSLLWLMGSTQKGVLRKKIEHLAGAQLLSSSDAGNRHA